MDINFTHMAEGMIGILAFIGAGTVAFAMFKFFVWLSTD